VGKREELKAQQAADQEAQKALQEVRGGGEEMGRHG